MIEKISLHLLHCFVGVVMVDGPVYPLPYVRRSDRTGRNYNRTSRVIHCACVVNYSIKPSLANCGVYLFTEYNMRANRTNQVVEHWPQVAFV